MDKVYVGGSLFSQAQINQRLTEGKLLKNIGVDYYNPIENDENNDKSNLPTAPVKLSGFPFSGRGFTLMVCVPVESDFSITRISYSPNQSRRPVGTSASKSILKGSMVLAPASNGYKITLRSTTML